MDPDSFAMSSYQFVNSLASCYPQSQLAAQQQQQQQHQHLTTGANQAASDYFSSPSYNPNLYNPAQSHYANQNYLAQQQQQQPQQQATAADMVDYTQLQPQRLLLPNQAGGLAATTAATPSCKYDQQGSNLNVTNGGPNVTPANSIASPQDLTTVRDIVSPPKLSPNTVVESVARSLSKNASSAVTSSNAQMLSSASNNNNNSSNNNSSHTTSVSLHSPAGDSETTSESGNEEGGRGSGGGNQTSSSKKGSGPPQIYPWMKRVHLGQSK